MNRPGFSFVVGLAALVPLAQAQVAPNKTANSTWKMARTADGHPDLQGFWANNNATPLERPKELAGRELLTESGGAAFQKKGGGPFHRQGGRAICGTGISTPVAESQRTQNGLKKTDSDTRQHNS